MIPPLMSSGSLRLNPRSIPIVRIELGEQGITDVILLWRVVSKAEGGEASNKVNTTTNLEYLKSLTVQESLEAAQHFMQRHAGSGAGDAMLLLHVVPVEDVHRVARDPFCTVAGYGLNCSDQARAEKELWITRGVTCQWQRLSNHPPLKEYLVDGVMDVVVLCTAGIQGGGGGADGGGGDDDDDSGSSGGSSSKGKGNRGGSGRPATGRSKGSAGGGGSQDQPPSGSGPPTCPSKAGQMQLAAHAAAVAGDRDRVWQSVVYPAVSDWQEGEALQAAVEHAGLSCGRHLVLNSKEDVVKLQLQPHVAAAFEAQLPQKLEVLRAGGSAPSFLKAAATGDAVTISPFEMMAIILLGLEAPAEPRDARACVGSCRCVGGLCRSTRSRTRHAATHATQPHTPRSHTRHAATRATQPHAPRSHTRHAATHAAQRARPGAQPRAERSAAAAASAATQPRSHVHGQAHSHAWSGAHRQHLRDCASAQTLQSRNRSFPDRRPYPRLPPGSAAFSSPTMASPSARRGPCRL